MAKLSESDLTVIQVDIERLWLNNCYKAYFKNSEDIAITPTQIPACDQSHFPVDLIQSLLDRGYKLSAKAKPYELNGEHSAYVEVSVSECFGGLPIQASEVSTPSSEGSSF